MDENHETKSIHNNCFLAKGTERENEIYLYDEAETLVYSCSRTSMPPKPSGYISAHKSADEAETTFGGSSNESKTSRRKSRKSCTIVHVPSNQITSATVKGGDFSKELVSDFRSAILSKFKEFAITPTSSTPKFGSKSGENGTDTRQPMLSKIVTGENNSEEVEELYIHKNKFLVSSSESDKVRNSSEDHEEVFSTGISDVEDVTNKIRNNRHPVLSSKITIEPDTYEEVTTRPIVTKSMVKEVDTRIERSVTPSPHRIGPPVQGRLSLKTMKATNPCFCLLDEIRKNNLIMKEDIFSTNTTNAIQKSDQKNTTAPPNNQAKICQMFHERNSVKQWNNRTANKKLKSVQQQATAEADEVYEAIGSDLESKNNGQGARQRGSTNQAPGVQLSNVTNSPLEKRDIYKSKEQTARPFSPPLPQDFNKRPNRNTMGVTCRREVPQVEKKDDQTRKPPEPTNQSNLTSESYMARQMSDYRNAKTSTPNRRKEKFVKLPGLVDAFIEKDSNFKDLRIKDGTSFESINVLEEMFPKKIAAHVGFQPEQISIADQDIPKTTKTKDVGTDFRIQLKNTLTQTQEDKTMIDTCVQCESHIVDTFSGRDIIKDGHKEIMVCNDNGTGEQLYNEQGHPLTDMDGYLLKDSYGRFLVRLDQFGVPISCTNGQAIYMGNGKLWDTIKNTMNVVHQSSKKGIHKMETPKKNKTCPSLSQLESALKNLKNTLDWADKISLADSNENSMNYFNNYTVKEHLNMNNLKTTRGPSKMWETINTTSLMSEMKLIAKLRNALLEKVNFIVDSKKPWVSPRKENAAGLEIIHRASYEKDWLSDPTVIGLMQNHTRPSSPTFQAIKNSRENRSRADEYADKFKTFEEDRQLSAIKLVGRDVDRQLNTSLQTATTDFKGSTLLSALERKYNLGLDNTWVESINKEPYDKPPINKEKTSKWSELKPRSDFNSDSSSNF